MLEAQRNAAGIRDEAANVQHQVFGDALIAQHREVLRVSRLLQGCDRRLTNASPKTVSEKGGFEPPVGLTLRLISSQVH